MQHRRRGAAAIEFVMWLPILAVLISGLVDIGWYMSTYHRVQRVAQDGARVGVRQAASETVANQGTLQMSQSLARANAVLPTVGLSGTVTTTYIQNSGTCPFDRLRVRVTVPFTPLIGLVPLPTTIVSEFNMASEIQR